MSNAKKPEIQGFFDEATNTVSYLVVDPASGAAAFVDPVLDFDPKSGKVSTASAGRLLAAAEKQRRGSNGSSRRTPMPTICRPRSTSRRRRARKSASARI